MRKLKKIGLSRETLRNLGVSLLHGAAGSAFCSKITACVGSCPCQTPPSPPDTGPVWTGPFYQGCPSYAC
jgi:hypothetical protein